MRVCEYCGREISGREEVLVALFKGEILFYACGKCEDR